MDKCNWFYDNEFFFVNPYVDELNLNECWFICFEKYVISEDHWQCDEMEHPCRQAGAFIFLRLATRNYYLLHKEHDGKSGCEKDRDPGRWGKCHDSNNTTLGLGWMVYFRTHQAEGTFRFLQVYRWSKGSFWREIVVEWLFAFRSVDFIAVGPGGSRTQRSRRQTGWKYMI